MLTSLCDILEEHHQKVADANPQFIRLQEYLEQRYTEKVNAKDVCDYMGMSESALHRFMKKKTESGLSLIERVHHIRIKHAMHLLRTTTDKVGSIGYSVGFESPSDFCEIFKRKMGMTPLKYRRNA